MQCALCREDKGSPKDRSPMAPRQSNGPRQTTRNGTVFLIVIKSGVQKERETEPIDCIAVIVCSHFILRLSALSFNSYSARILLTVRSVSHRSLSAECRCSDRSPSSSICAVFYHSASTPSPSATAAPQPPSPPPFTPSFLS